MDGMAAVVEMTLMTYRSNYYTLVNSMDGETRSNGSADGGSGGG